jgi:hypothetical protein
VALLVVLWLGWKSSTSPPPGRTSPFAPIFGATLLPLLIFVLSLFDLTRECERTDRVLEILPIFRCERPPQLRPRDPAGAVSAG